jgi:surface antigen
VPFDNSYGSLDWDTFCGPWTVPLDPQNAFAGSFGQCVYWALEKRPDIYADRSADDDLVNWDAWTWVTHAQREGLDVDGNPRPGDVAVWSQALAGDDTGHVAYVESVGADGSITISEYNSRFGTAGGDTTVLTDTGSDGWPGLEFIHLTGNVAPLARNSTPPSQPTRPSPNPQAERSMRPSRPHSIRRGQQVTLTVAIAAGSGAVDAIATHAGAVRTLSRAASSTSSRFVFKAKLAPGRWTLQVRYRPAPAYKAPTPARLTLRIPRGLTSRAPNAA